MGTGGTVRKLCARGLEGKHASGLTVRVLHSLVYAVGGRGDHGGRRTRDEEGRKEASGSRSHHDSRDVGESLRQCQGIGRQAG